MINILIIILIAAIALWLDIRREGWPR